MTSFPQNKVSVFSLLVNIATEIINKNKTKAHNHPKTQKKQKIIKTHVKNIKTNKTATMTMTHELIAQKKQHYTTSL